MINFKQAVFQSRINTIIGSLFIGSWALGCGLILWQASFDQNPLANTIVEVLYNEMQEDF